MAIICIRLEAEGKLAYNIPRPLVGNSHLSAEETRRMGDYRDILSVTRVLIHGPESKADVDAVIDRYMTRCPNLPCKSREKINKSLHECVITN